MLQGAEDEALRNTLSGEWPRYRMNHETGRYEADGNKEPYTGVIGRSESRRRGEPLEGAIFLAARQKQ
jgi:sulfate adenylyltransferase subunit 2